MVADSGSPCTVSIARSRICVSWISLGLGGRAEVWELIDLPICARPRGHFEPKKRVAAEVCSCLAVGKADPVSETTLEGLKRRRIQSASHRHDLKRSTRVSSHDSTRNRWVGNGDSRAAFIYLATGLSIRKFYCVHNAH